MSSNHTEFRIDHESTITGLLKFNILMGKNGCGKSRLLRSLREKSARKKGDGPVYYLSPERGGVVQYDEGIANQLNNDPELLNNSRAGNQAGQFRHQSLAQLRRLEWKCLHKLQDKNREGIVGEPFDKTLAQINRLLDNVYIKSTEQSLRVVWKDGDIEHGAGSLSSGEAETISLAIECLIFEDNCRAGGRHMLFMDEPDLHMHPDLQDRFGSFLLALDIPDGCHIVIATHSTPMLSALTRDCTTVCFMKKGQTTLDFGKTTDALQKILPVFGTHPLSNVFNQKRLLLVEGDDDERIWQQAVRSSEGRIQVNPCPAGSKNELNQYELEANRLIAGIYDNPIALSLRDRDVEPYEIDDVGLVRRMRLEWREVENLILTKEVLDACHVSWDELKDRIRRWLENFTSHQHFALMKNFAEGGFDRKTAKITYIINIIAGLMGTNKPWEVLLGQTIAKISRSEPSIDEYSLEAALGKRVMEFIVRPG